MCAVESLSMAGGGGGRWSGRKQEVEAARAENTGYCGADYHFAERVISIVLSRRGIYLDLRFIKIPLGVWSMENSIYGGWRAGRWNHVRFMKILFVARATEPLHGPDACCMPSAPPPPSPLPCCQTSSRSTARP